MAYFPSQQTEATAEEQPAEEAQTEESSDTQATETTEEAVPLIYGIETVSVSVSVPDDSYYGLGERIEATWTYNQITSSQ